MILAVGDTVWNGLIAAVCTVTLAWFSYRASVKVESVKSDLAKTDEKVSSLAVVADKTHTLVNSNMGLQLKISAVALHRLADMTNNADDIAAAEVAQKALDEHQTKQASVDAKENK